MSFGYAINLKKKTVKKGLKMLLIYYMLIINILAFILFGVDKKKAEKEKFRIPESRLILVAALGGAYGAILGMLIFRHKIRKNKFRITVPVLVVLYTALMGYFLYNNYHLVTTEYEYSSFEVPAELDGYTIVQISDLHNQTFGLDESYLLDKIKEADPDIIVVTGDAVDITHTNYKPTEIFFEGAVKIAPVYYITGNHEVWLSNRNKAKYEEYIKTIEGYGVNYIDDTTVDMDGYTLAGVSDEKLGSTIELHLDNADSEVQLNVTNTSGDASSNTSDNTANKSTVNVLDDRLVVMLAHEPDYLRYYEEAGADLVLVGHNHGGQIVIPGKGGLVSADIDFFPELCEGEHTSGDTTMIISRGLGNSLFPCRINNYPEIVKVVLRREEHKLMHLYMPEVVGLDVDSAKKKLKDLGFFNIVLEYEEDEYAETGRVIRQSIPPDTTVSTEFEIVLTISD